MTQDKLGNLSTCACGGLKFRRIKCGRTNDFRTNDKFLWQFDRENTWGFRVQGFDWSEEWLDLGLKERRKREIYSDQGCTNNTDYQKHKKEKTRVK